MWTFPSVKRAKGIRPGTRTGPLVRGVIAGVVLSLSVGLLAVGGALAATPPPSAAPQAVAVHPDVNRNVKASLAGHKSTAVCPPARPGHASCNSVRDEFVGGPLASPAAVPLGYAPTDLQAAYKLPSGTAGSGMRVAVVDAMDDPTAEADLGVYRAKYGLPACTTTNGCFTRIDQRGGTAYPPADTGWSQEISLDLDVVSAACPLCNILLVEADSSSLSDLGTAVNMAVTKGAVAVSNSYGAASTSDDTSFDGYFNHPGVAITASSGDNGYGADYPAASQFVTAVGGTSLVKDSSARGWSEAAWSGTGGGCSTASAKPAWQTDTGCTTKTISDVSAVADPQTGIAVYYAANGWMVLGGTSASSPLIAATYALAGRPDPGTAPAGFPYSRPGQLNDVTSGSSGTCTVAYLCSGEAGYDGPTGLGTPSGVGAFTNKPMPSPSPTPSPTPSPSPPPRAITSAADTVYADSSGRLFDVPATGGGTLGSPRQIGNGFSNIKDMHVTDWNSDGIADLLVQWNSGRVSVYLGSGGGLAYGPVIATQGWAGITLTVGKWSKAAPYPWLVGTNAAGGLYYWANRHGTAVDAAVQIGRGWTGLKITQLDFDGDGNQDLLVRTTAGTLLLYRGNGAGQVVSETRRTIGSGWQGFDSLDPVPGFTGTGSRGLTARNTGTGLRYYYPIHNGTWGARVVLGGSWKGLTLAD